MAVPLPKSAENYRIAWITALKIETASALQMFDEEHAEPTDFRRHPEDQNCYDWGRIHSHDIVLISLPAAGYGKVNAATCVAELMSSLPWIKFGLLVGIGAGLPNAQNDIRLGDVVVSQPERSHGGVIQYDLGKAIADGTWEPKGLLNPPPRVLLNALGRLQARHECENVRLVEFLEQAVKRNPRWGANYVYPIDAADCLFKYERPSNTGGNENHIVEVEITRSPRPSHDPFIHYGTIASGDTLVKDENTRIAILDKIKQSCLCLEMEAAGMMNKFPCLVIRGISDYADRHKNDDWQRYASATAAAFAKELLLYVPTDEVKYSQNAIDRSGLQATFNLLKNQVSETEDMLKKQKVDNLLRDLYTCPYTERKDRNAEALDGTCQWFIRHTRFVNFVTNSAAKLLWVSADPGCGKSVLAKYLVDKILVNNEDEIIANIEDRIICYFFFKDDFVDQNRSAQAISALLRQLICADPGALKEELLNKHVSSGELFRESFQDLWQALLSTAANSASKSIICVLDALDECQSADMRILIKAISDWHRGNATSNLKILVTSRPYFDIKDDFHDITVNHPSIHLDGENSAEAEEISKEIDIVIKHRVRMICNRRRLPLEVENALVEKLIKTKQRTYLWAYLTMDLIENTLGLTVDLVQNILSELPLTVNQAYEKILNRSQDPIRTRVLLHILMAAQRPLSIEEVSIASALTEEQKDVNDLIRAVEPPDTFKDTIRDLCGLLIVIKDSHVYFLHQTTREFLSPRFGTSKELLAPVESKTDSVSQIFFWCKSFPPIESHRLLAGRCLWFLFTSGSLSYHKSFFEYCQHCWILHFRDGEIPIDSPLNDLALEIFQHWSSNYEDLDFDIRDYHCLGIWKPLKHSIPTIFFPSWFGLPYLLETLLNRDPIIRDREDAMYSALSLACQAGNVKAVRILLAYGAMIHGTHGHFSAEYSLEAPLISAMDTSNWDLAHLLLQHDSAIVAVNEDCGMNLLHYAAPGLVTLEGLEQPFRMRFNGKVYKQYDIETIRTLIELGAKVEARTESGAMPIHYFLDGAHTMSKEEGYGGSYDPKLTSLTSLHTAIKLLLPSGTDINRDDDESGANLMSFAALTGEAKLIQVMLMLGGSIHTQDQKGNNLLHHAAVSWNDGGALDFAWSHGVDIESRNDDGLTPLLLALGTGYPNPYKALLRLGANPNARDKKGRTPLMREFCDAEVNLPRNGTWLERDYELPNYDLSVDDVKAKILFLIAAGTDVNAKDVDGWSCIHYAASSAIGYLLPLFEYPIDINSTTNAGQTALHLVGCRNNNRLQRRYLIRALLEQSADPDIVDNDGRTALWYIEDRLRELERKAQGPQWIYMDDIEEADLIHCLVLLKYGLGIELDSLIGFQGFVWYLKQAIGEAYTWPRIARL